MSTLDSAATPWGRGKQFLATLAIAALLATAAPTAALASPEDDPGQPNQASGLIVPEQGEGDLPPEGDETGSPAPEILAPEALALAGVLQVGQQVTIPGTGWTPEGTAVRVNWQIDGATVAQQTAPDSVTQNFGLTLLPEWAGKQLSAQVHGSLAAATDKTVQVSGGLVAPGKQTAPGTVKTSGTAKVGGTITAVPGAWDLSQVQLSYRWLIAGAQVGTGATFVPADAHYAKDLSLEMVAQRLGYDPLTQTVKVAKIGLGDWATQGALQVSGSVRVGTTLTATTGTWKPSAKVTFSWKVNGKTVGSSAKFTPSASHKGHKPTVTAVIERAGYKKVTLTKTLGTIGSGVFTTAPTPKISGTAAVNHTLKVSAGSWSPKASLKYQWLRNGKAIPKATGTSYKLVTADGGTRITVRVTGTKTAYTTKSVTSAKTVTVLKRFTATPAPKITGSTHVLSTLKASATWKPGATFTYQWMRSGKAISGATKSTYKLAAADYGKTITVKVTGSRYGYVKMAATSKATGKVSGPKAALSRPGTFRVGTQIKPGTYVANAQGGCYWERRSNGSRNFDGIIANEFVGANGREIVTILPSDKYFYTTDDCGSWTPYVGIGSKATSFGNGVHVVGTHIRPGYYYNSSSAYGCYFEFLSGFTGNFSEILDNEFTYDTYWVYLHPDDERGFSSYDCGTWRWSSY